ncbi:hypothetical protein [Anaerococcus lactolyticus]|uniref:hypothetical protein n=1 Tax=Anaerococcus lactolyticus TaxID=33032 RepID=UPI00288A0B1D|nr:hypothetical protein [Anaerococcus lactolyticus]
MNKKLIASLLTLGLILSPVSGAVGSRSMVSEARADESDYSKVISPSDRIKASIADYEKYKNTNLYRLASKEYKDEIDKVVDLAKEFIGKNSVSDSDLKDISEKLHDASQNLIKSSQSNLYNFKAKILNAEKVLRDNVDKNTTEESKEEFEKIDKIIKDSKVKLKDDQLAKLDGEELEKSTNEILGLLEDAKTHQNFKYENYYPSVEEIERLDAEINNEGEEVSEEKLANLADDIKKLVDGNGDFQNSPSYELAKDEEKTAYTTAFDKIKDLPKPNKDNYYEVVELVKTVARARKVIEKKDLDLSVTKANRDVAEIIDKFKAHLADSEKLLEKLKDDKLSSDYKVNLALADIYIQNYDNNLKRSIKDYQDLEAELDRLVKDIKKSKGEGEVRPEDKKKEKIEKLEKLLDRVKAFMRTDSYKKGKDIDRKALEEAVKVAEDLINKYKFSESWVSDDELSEAINKLEKAYAKFEKSDDKALIKKLIEDLLKSTEGIRIDQIYGKDEKDAKNAYTKAREAAAKAAKDKNISLSDLTKAYENFKDARDKLAEFLTSRLKKLVDDDSNFTDTEKYKQADRSLDAKDVDAILNYRSLIRDSKEELDKTSPDANKLDLLYKKLDAARREIEGKLSSQARKLTDAILDSDDFMASLAFKAAATGSDKYLKYAAEKYKADLKMAKKLSEAGKLDSKEAEAILESLSKSRDFIEDKISQKAYLIFEYTRTLEEIKNHKDYKSLNQALRKRLEAALDLAHKGGDEDEIFRALDEVMNDDAIKAFIKKIELEKNPNKVRDKLLIDLTNLINEDKKLKEGSFKYTKAQKALRDAYDLALKEAKDLIADNKNPKEAEVKAVYQKLLKAKNALDGDKFDKLINDLAARFKKNQLKIASVEARKAIAAKINALSDPKATMDDALRVEKELNDLINPKYAATTTLTPTNQVQTSTRPVSTVTKPGSIVKTGINGIAKVAAVLVVAAIILKLTSKKGDKK